MACSATTALLQLGGEWYPPYMAGETQATDLIDRPEWRPPSNSPYKDVGPPSLGPLLESPSPVPQRQQTKSKEVKFFSTPKVPEEHDIGMKINYFHEKILLNMLFLIRLV